MPLLKDGAFQENSWTEIADDQAIPVEKPVIVSFERLLGDDSEYLFHCGPCLGVRVKSKQDVLELKSWLKRIRLIVLEFQAFSDGRAYSQARMLRRMGYRGEIRATGDVLVDQYQMMRRCGFSSYEIREGRNLVSWNTAINSDLNLRYQAEPGLESNDIALNILSARHKTVTEKAA